LALSLRMVGCGVGVSEGNPQAEPNRQHPGASLALAATRAASQRSGRRAYLHPPTGRLCLPSCHLLRVRSRQVWANSGNDWRRIEVPTARIPRISSDLLAPERRIAGRALVSPLTRFQAEGAGLPRPLS
jgi:hypothetical protein